MVSKAWRRFRDLPLWVQIVAWVMAGLAALSPFAEDPDDGVQVAANVPSTTTTLIEPTTAPPPATTTTSVPVGLPAGDDTTVTRVIDGDTIEVSGGTRVRLIGVDAPETVEPGAPVGCFGLEATRYLNELIPAGSPIRLVYDVGRLDQYGRTLAYVYKLTDGVFVNRALLRNGFAAQLTVSPNVNHAEAFRTAVAEARTASLGLWASCQTTTTTTAPRVTVPPTTAPPATRGLVTPASTTTIPAGSGCHPSYSGACVPMGFSDVDCAGGSGDGPGYVSAKRFQVVGADVYRLDSDNDGIACES
ncbi:MAG TPA: thermonuclease family protein [Acidimicrobiales bacterium]|nr:thermonuclease family protein [Acidimicrobiales bacterium]